MSTLAEIDSLLVEADRKLKALTDQTVWFKAQRDWWRSRLEWGQALFQTEYTGPATKSKAAAIATAGFGEEITLPWDGNRILNLPEMVLYCDFAYDLVQKRYDYMHSHLLTLMARNKAIMLEYNSGRSQWA